MQELLDDINKLCTGNRITDLCIWCYYLFNIFNLENNIVHYERKWSNDRFEYVCT